jgi:hypothetical protein
MVWYYHQPTVSTDAEVNDMLLTSFLPLVRSHAATSRKVTIAITGVLVDRIARIAPNTLNEFRALLDSGVCELAGTTYHEVLPPFVPIRYLKRQIERDLTAKWSHLRQIPTFFHPTAFTWSGALQEILPDLGFRRLVIDEAHYAYATSTQLWRWTVGQNANLTSILQPTFFDRRELHRPHRYAIDADRSLMCFIRDVELVRDLSFGSIGSIHQPLEREALDEFIERLANLCRADSRITLADDGDRINPVSLAPYQRLLHALPEDAFLTPRDDTENVEPKTLFYLPSFSIADQQQFWLSDLDSVQYLRLLDEIYEYGVPLELEEELLELQDVFFLFWKTVPRKRYYLKKALALWNRINEATSVLSDP